jgi:predicted RNA-binding Zn-ribbon protein involved in translation (DUF1610 family)
VPIKVTCSGCGVSLTTPDNSAGKQAKCPKCGQAIQISEAKADVLDAETSIFDDLSEEDMTSGETVQDDRKPCPACGEMIVRKAIKCRYCGEIFDPALKEQEQKQARKRSASAEGEDMSTGDWVVAIICSGIGCIAGIIWMIQGKPKGKKMFLVSFGMAIFWSIVQALLDAANKNM